MLHHFLHSPPFHLLDAHGPQPGRPAGARDRIVRLTRPLVPHTRYGLDGFLSDANGLQRCLVLLRATASTRPIEQSTNRRQGSGPESKRNSRNESPSDLCALLTRSDFPTQVRHVEGEHSHAVSAKRDQARRVESCLTDGLQGGM